MALRMTPVETAPHTAIANFEVLASLPALCERVGMRWLGLFGSAAVAAFGPSTGAGSKPHSL